MPSPDTRSSRRLGLIRRTLARRRWPIFAQWSLLTVALLTTAFLYLQGPYRASAFLRVDPFVPDLFGTRGEGNTLEAFLKTQIQLIQSPNVLTSAATNPTVAKLPRNLASNDAVQTIRKAISATVVPDTYLIEVSTDWDDGLGSAMIVNAVVEAFMEANSEWSDGMTRTQIKGLEAFSLDLKNRTDELERRWKDVVANGDVDLLAKKANLINAEHATRIAEKLVEIDLARLEAQAQLEVLKSRSTKDQAKIEELETRVEASNILERSLIARRASRENDPKVYKTDAVEIWLLQDERKTIKDLQEPVNRRIEQLRFEAKGEARIRPVNVATPPGRRVELWYRSLVLGLIPFATFAFVLTIYSGVEAWLGSKAKANLAHSPEEG